MSINNPNITSYRDAFLIDTTYIRRLNLDWPDGGGVTGGTYGWFGGGTDASFRFSTVDRIDFANDSPTSASPRGPLDENRRSVIGVSNYTK